FGSFFGKGPLDLTPLALTDEQKQKIQQMRSDNAGKARELMRKRRELGGQMKEILFGPDSTDAQIKAKRDELRQVQEKLEDIRLDDMLAIRS
ncbi:periplasmic heavy metal sensor, partial [Acinetobacter baumannii]